MQDERGSRRRARRASPRSWAPAALALLSCACGGPPARAASAPGPSEVRVAADATVAQLVRAIRGALIARGHAGECFLAWDAGGEERLTVHVGDRSREAAVSCGGLRAVAPALEGRCPALRFFWVAGEDLRTEAVSFYFGPPGSAHAARPIAGASVETPAVRAVFDERVSDARLVLGVPLPERAAPKQGPADDEPRDGREPADRETREPADREAREPDGPLRDPEVREALVQLVRRIQRCNPSGEGSLVLEWHVERDGTIAGVQEVTSTVSDAALECAVDVLRASSFPEHDRETPIDYCAPVLLDPSLRP